MDVFFEQIIHKKLSTLQKILKIAIILASIAFIISLIFFAISMLGTIFPPIIALLAVGVGFGARWYVKRMYLEYEYSLTNGDFDIDRIWGKSKRERVISTNCKDFEEIGPYNEKTMRRLRPIEFDAKVIAANLDEEGLFYITTNHKKAGLVLIILQPDERLKQGFKKFVPRFIQNGVDWD
ncbi:MAG: hypothetical protein IJD90_04390 [Clostridia bacterium]|nr:hypothetical protein [Clostridia bacterium]